MVAGSEGVDDPHASGPMTASLLTPDLLRSYAPDPGPYRIAEPPAWLDELDLSVTSARARMGTRGLPEASWLLRDRVAHPELQLRRRLLTEQREHVLACTPHAERPAREVESLVDRWLAAHGRTDGADPEEDHPLARAGGRVQEDLCLMVHHDDAWRLEGAVLCFPSLWLLAGVSGLAPCLAFEVPKGHFEIIA